MAPRLKPAATLLVGLVLAGCGTSTAVDGDLAGEVADSVEPSDGVADDGTMEDVTDVDDTWPDSVDTEPQSPDLDGPEVGDVSVSVPDVELDLEPEVADSEPEVLDAGPAPDEDVGQATDGESADQGAATGDVADVGGDGPDGSPDGDAVADDDEDCDDGDPCSVDTWDAEAGACVHGPACDDGDPCTVDTCSPDGACGTAPLDMTCHDPPASTCVGDTAQYYSAYGECAAVDGQAACVYQVLIEESCSGDPCCVPTVCEPGSGCVYPDPFLLDYCYSPGPCVQPNGTLVSCEDGDPCTDDGYACTDHPCHPQFGCISEPVECPEDGSPCTTPTCEAVTGCGQEPVVCEPDDACHEASCDPVFGCVETPLECGESTPCSTISCDPAIGCVTSDPCEDGDPCTDDLCNPDDGDCTHVTTDGCP